ncbi:MAG: hypothetical protein KJ990_12445 [Proteobacteria bacterium]|nr:hypothetical protein [Pseudomonadota bacterium]MBU1648252.1 hypothetical protein [Pseudomonadota bacterium]MBU1986146.1 hypothetical protein [Pseudomonadota bacterium]
MRCSKCGYISFDHQESCRKCHKPMAGGDLKGTTYDVVVPLFLQFSSEMDVSEHEEDLVDVLDPDLDLLAVENEDVIEFEDSEVDSQEIVMKDDMQSSGTSDISSDDDFEIEFSPDNKDHDLSFDEEDLFLDTSRFEDVPINVQAVQAAQTTGPAPFEIPEGLADISDLARPASGAAVKNDLDTDFDLDDLDLSFGGEKGSDVDSSADEGDLATLSLDDLDLSGALQAPPPPPQSSSLPADDDLNFDLDLGDVGEGHDTSEKKGSDDLADLSLSLD